MLVNHDFHFTHALPIFFNTPTGTAAAEKGEIHIDLSAGIARGWFYAEVRFEPMAVGELEFRGSRAKQITFPGLIVRCVAQEFGNLYRHEFTTDPAEADPQWRPEESRPKPVPIDFAELKAALAKVVKPGGREVVFDAQGGFRPAP